MSSKKVFSKVFSVKNSVVNVHDHHSADLKTSEETNFVDHLVKTVPGHYMDENIYATRLKKLGFPKTAKILKEKMPKTKRIRSGELGEILAHEYIVAMLNYEIPIKKLNWKDSRDMALRGDDVIGFVFQNGKKIPNKVIKCEAKSRVALSGATVSEIEAALTRDGGKPSPNALVFISDQLHRAGEVDKALQIDEMVSKGFKLSRVEHLGFTFSGNSSSNLLSSALGKYTGAVKRTFVGMVATNHQRIIKAVFDAIAKKKK